MHRFVNWAGLFGCVVSKWAPSNEGSLEQSGRGGCWNSVLVEGENRRLTCRKSKMKVLLGVFYNIFKWECIIGNILLLPSSCLQTVYDYCNPIFHMSMNSPQSVIAIFWHPSVVIIPSEHSLSKLAALPSHFNTMSLAIGQQSCRVTSCTQESLLCLIAAEIMRAGKGFVLPLRTPIAADSTAGIFSCCSCWRADRRAHRGSDVRQTAGSLFSFFYCRLSMHQ